MMDDHDDAGMDDEGADTDATWIDNSPAENRRDVSVGSQQRHENQMQSRALLGVGALFVITLVVVIIAPWTGAISEDFARTLAQMIIPTLLTAAGTIIGTLFRSSK